MRRVFKFLGELAVIAFVILASQRIGYHIGMHYGVTNGDDIALLCLFSLLVGMNIGKSVEIRRARKARA